MFLFSLRAFSHAIFVETPYMLSQNDTDMVQGRTGGGGLA